MQTILCLCVCDVMNCVCVCIMQVNHQPMFFCICVCLHQKAKPFHLALDVGCGSGQGTVFLAPHFTHVVGIDVSSAMLEFAMASDHPPNVSYRSGSTGVESV